MDTDKWSINTPKTLEVDGVTALDVGIVRGRLDIITHDETTTRIEVSEVSGGPLDISFAHGTLSIRPAQPDNWLRKVAGNHRAVLSIAIPEGVAVVAATVSGDGLVCGTSTTTALKTVSGSILADDTSGHLEMDTVSGEIIARFHNGPLTARSVSGELTASGFLESIQARTVSGDLSFDLAGATQDIVSTSVSGDVTVRIPAGTGIALTAKTTSGTVVVGEQRFSGTAQSLRVSDGPQDFPMQIHTTSVSGDVSVVSRAQQVPAATIGVSGDVD